MRTRKGRRGGKENKEEYYERSGGCWNVRVMSVGCEKGELNCGD